VPYAELGFAEAVIESGTRDARARSGGLMTMKHWLRRIALTASVAGAVAPLPGNAHAEASDPPAGSRAAQPQPNAMLHQGGGLATQALDLASLTPLQRTQIQQLVAERRSAAVPVSRANRILLTKLADQVDQASIDRDKLAPAVGAVDSAVDAAMPVQLDALNRLHKILTPGQRNTVVDRAEARIAERRAAARETWASDESPGPAEAAPEHAVARLGLTSEQKSEVVARAGATRARPSESLAEQTSQFLEEFRSDGFDARAFAHPPRAGEHEAKVAEVVLPVLTPAQRTMYATILRDRAQRT
jgi:Spy/CpxP family protein refolding chaperone